MKHFTNLSATFIAVFLIAISCNSSSSKSEATLDASNPTNSQPTEQITENEKLVDSAKALIIASNEYVKKAIKGEMKNPQVNDSIHPLMNKFFVIYKKLPPADTLILYKFRIDQLNELAVLMANYKKR